METGLKIKQALALALAIPFFMGTALGQEDIREKAFAAIRSGDHEAAIQFCLDGLKRNHLDYELNFLLSRAYAFSGRRDNALRVLNDLALAYPENTDILLFRARVESWKKNYGAAERGYNEVLRLSPGNSEALTGLAEVASWQGDYGRAIALYNRMSDEDPENADVHFRLGRVYLWDGKFAPAEARFREALRLAPDNDEYRRAFRKVKPRLTEKFELRYERQADSFSDGRGRYLDQNLALQLNISRNMGPLVLKYNHTHRFGRNDDRYGLEFYPRLWKRSYGYLDLAFSSKRIHYPGGSYLLEVYQGILSGGEVSLGYRRMDFASAHVSQILGSLGYYFGNYYAFWRWFYSGEEAGDRFSWLANFRRYFSAENFVFLSFGRGARPKEFVTLEDVRADRSWVLAAGFDWYFLKKIRLRVYYSRGNEQALRRQTLLISTGYRW